MCVCVCAHVHVHVCLCMCGNGGLWEAAGTLFENPAWGSVLAPPVHNMNLR